MFRRPVPRPARRRNHAVRKIDEASKTLFVGSVVADAIRFAKPELAAMLDLGSIEPLPAEYVGRDAGGTPGKRFGDSAFRIPFKEGRFPLDAAGGAAGGGRLYLLVAGEFQHASDATMLERVREYAAWQDAHYRQQDIVRPGEHPPLLPIVFHTGPDRWTADDGMEVYRGLPEGAAAQLAPQQRQAYIPLEVGCRSTLAVPEGNRLGALLRLTSAATTPELVAALAEEWRRFGGDANRPVRRGLREWTQQMMLGLGDEAVELPSFEELEGAKEDGTMEYLLEDHVREWRAELHSEGERNMLARLAERRFGAEAAHRLSAALNGTPSRQRLDELGDLVVLCGTAEELVERLDG